MGFCWGGSGQTPLLCPRTLLRSAKVTTWTDIDEPVLRWVAEQGPSLPPGWMLKLELRPTIPSVDIPGLDEAQIHDALLRLESAGLVAANDPQETNAHVYWSRLRVTARGSMVLGAWPDLDQVDAVEAMQVSLAALAEAEPDPERRTALRRAAGLLGSLGASVAIKIATGAAADAGGELL